MINLQNVANTVKNIKRNLLSEYVTIKFIGMNKTTRRREYLGTMTEGFHYKEIKNPETGIVIERVEVVTKTPTQYSWVDNCVDIELIKADNTFRRFSIPRGKVKPKVPMFQWVIDVRPNNQDNDSIV